MIEITRYHDISMGHRVYGHESKCANLHGHNYRFYFTCRPKDGLDEIGRVIDFGKIKEIFCQWLEINWDHKTLIWNEDPIYASLTNHVIFNIRECQAIVPVPFNPTAENIAYYFITRVAPELTRLEDFYLYSITLNETAKCSAYAKIDPEQEYELSKKYEKTSFPYMKVCSIDSSICQCKGKLTEEIAKCPNCIDDLPF